MKLDVALIIISSVTLFGVVIFYVFASFLRNKINELVIIKKSKKKFKSSSRNLKLIFI